MTINFEELASELTTINMQLERLEERKQEITEIFRTNLESARKHAFGEFTVAISKPSESPDLPAIAERFPAAEYPQLYKPVFDVKKAAEQFTPETNPELFTPAIQRDLVKEQMAPSFLREQGLYKVGTPSVKVS